MYPIRLTNKLCWHRRVRRLLELLIATVIDLASASGALIELFSTFGASSLGELSIGSFLEELSTQASRAWASFITEIAAAWRRVDSWTWLLVVKSIQLFGPTIALFIIYWYRRYKARDPVPKGPSPDLTSQKNGDHG